MLYLLSWSISFDFFTNDESVEEVKSLDLDSRSDKKWVALSHRRLKLVHFQKGHIWIVKGDIYIVNQLGMVQKILKNQSFQSIQDAPFPTEKIQTVVPYNLIEVQ